MPVSVCEATSAAPGSRGVVSRLRGTSGERPEVDAGLAGGLRDWLEDGLSEAVAALPGGGPPVRVTKEAVNQVLVCEAHFLAARDVARPLSLELARGLLVDALFRQWITTGDVSDPWEDAVASLAVSSDGAEMTAFLGSLGSDARQALRGELHSHLEHMTASWPPPSPSWMARTQERLIVPLAGGQVVLSGVVDLALGTPSAGRASVCIVEVKSGRRRIEHRGDLHLYALLETLRSGAPPFRIATFYTATGELDVEPVGRDALTSALHRVLAAGQRLCRLAAGAEPQRTPNPLCSHCTGLPACPPGRQRVDAASRA
ncbi:MAG TPA: hypothetical protein DCQ30_05705 [Acidimicrobiaceae bacterium]|nr:hypothetical protein [Acidimicrobiaceae bacterium]